MLTDDVQGSSWHDEQISLEFCNCRGMELFVWECEEQNCLRVKDTGFVSFQGIIAVCVHELAPEF